MEFRIADTFTDSLARLTGDEQKAGKTTAFDLQLNPAAPGLKFHKLDKARDKNFWSVRAIENVGDEGDLQEVYDTERQLLYVACTRARDHLLVTGVEPASEFVDDLDRAQGSRAR